MDKIIVSCLAMLIVGCQDATVLSNDGGVQTGYCTSSVWVKCVHKLCPNGYDVVRDSDGVFGGNESIIKCKPFVDHSCDGVENGECKQRKSGVDGDF